MKVEVLIVTLADNLPEVEEHRNCDILGDVKAAELADSLADSLEEGEARTLPDVLGKVEIVALVDRLTS